MAVPVVDAVISGRQTLFKGKREEDSLVAIARPKTFQGQNTHIFKHMPDPQHRTKIQCQTEEELMAHSSFILKEPDALFSTYKMRLRIARIDGIHTPSDVFNESYARIAAMIRNGKPVKNLVALYHAVGHNVIREYSRAHQRQNKIRDRVEKHKQTFQPDGQTYRSEEAFKDLKRKVLNCVNPFEAKIIFLYHSEENPTWKDVCQALIDAGDIPEKEVSMTLINRIKKQYSRAIKRIDIK